ncbi:MAG: aldehyde dehydrogenase family protein [Elusimicrobia bacterium]|nr:aldehyde dehydrogenase family protein [Elusimicrobiota bacterium]
MNPTIESAAAAAKPHVPVEDIRAAFEAQRLNRWRIAQTTAKERAAKLRRLKEAILSRKEELHEALRCDFQKNPGEADLTEIFPVISEINHTIAHLPRWMRPVRVKTPLALFGARSEVRLEAKGLVLILSPWNYPFHLLINPLVAALAAGNCVILKPSSKVPRTSQFIRRFIADLFPSDEVAVFEGSAAVSDALLELPFDHIFFTGSPRIGRTIMAAASKHLTTLTLELGGKSPVIIDETADIRKAAERTVWGKFLNAGQTCVAPDYLLIHESRLEDFLSQAKKIVAERFGGTEDARRASPDFCRLVSLGHQQGLSRVLEESLRHGAKVEIGGIGKADERYLAPTLLSNIREDSPIMKEEIFGPILPIIAYKNLEEVFRIIRSKEKPLALYVFSQSEENIERVLRNTTAGGTCVNTMIVHLANPDLPFGGVGASGMGNYHGYHGFRALSHERAVLRQGWIDTLRFFYPPYTAWVRRLIRLATKYLT